MRRPRTILEQEAREIMYSLKWYFCEQETLRGRKVYLLPGGQPDKKEGEDYTGFFSDKTG